MECLPLSKKGGMPQGFEKYFMHSGVAPLKGGTEGEHGNAGNPLSSWIMRRLPEKDNTLPLHEKRDFTVDHGSQKFLELFQLFGITKSSGSSVGYVQKITLLHLLDTIQTEGNRRASQIFQEALIPIPPSPQRGMP
jgi:hypothetical protein